MNMMAFLEAVFCSLRWRRRDSIEGCSAPGLGHGLFNCCLTDFLCNLQSSASTETHHQHKMLIVRFILTHYAQTDTRHNAKLSVTMEKQHASIFWENNMHPSFGEKQCFQKGLAVWHKLDQIKFHFSEHPQTRHPFISVQFYHIPPYSIFSLHPSIAQ